MNKYLYLLLFALFPVLALAANDQTFDGANISVGGNTFVANGNADQLSVSGSDFAVVLSPGGSITITSSDKKILTNTLNRKTTCGTNSSSVTLDWPSGESSAFEVTVTPSSTSCTTNEGGGTISVGGSSSGGGGSAASIPVSQAVQAVASTPAPTVSKSQTSAIILFARDLSLGTSGTDVQKLQELLAKDPGIYPEGIISGYYGPATTRAVRAFQAKYGLSAVGRVGPQTRAKLNEVFGTASVPAQTAAKSAEVARVVPPVFNTDLSLGQTDDDVRRLQELLAKDPGIYPEGIISGYYGPATTRAVRAFQAKYGLSAVGRVGPQTRAKLNEVFGQPVHVPPTTPSSSSADQLKTLQDQLKALQDQLKALKK